MKYSDFLREARLRTVGVDGWRLVGEGLLVPVGVQNEEAWRARYTREIRHGAAEIFGVASNAIEEIAPIELENHHWTTQ